MALHDEVERTQVLYHPDEPLMYIQQIQRLPHFAAHHPDLFHQKLHIYPDIFNNILDCINENPIFQNNSNNHQLPIALQLAIFVNHVDHYGHVISNEDICQWVGVSVGFVTNYTNRIMTSSSFPKSPF